MSITAKNALRVMKLTALLLTVFSLHVMAKTEAQTISYEGKNVSLKTVFAEIKKQTQYFVVYNATEIETSRKVNVQAKNESLPKFLSRFLDEQGLKYRIEDNTIVVSPKEINTVSVTHGSNFGLEVQSPALLITVKGRVVNENGEPRIASVIVKGTQNGTSTGADGYFTLTNVDENATLIITGISIEKSIEVKVMGRNDVGNISTITKVSVLDETYVIAYGKSSRRLATGSVTSVKKEEITKQAISNPLSILPGRVAGLQVTQVSGTPGSPFVIRLRGQNSIASGNDPLIIVDGVPYPYNSLNSSFGGGILASPLATLNSSDIESIEVLKDADATSIYGSRGANGVILISTRKAQSSTTNISIRSYAGFGKIANRMSLLNTPQYIRMRKEAFANDGVVPTATNAFDLAVWDTTRYTDWQKELIGNTMHVADTKLEFSGGNAQTRFLFGAGYHGESTVLPDNKFGEKKISANINVQHRTTDRRFRFSLTAGYARNVTNLPINDLSGYILLAPNAPALYNSEGKLNWENSTWQNPLSELEKTYRSESDNLLTNMNISYQISKGLEVKATLGYSMVNVRDNTSTPKKSFDPAITSQANAVFGNSFINTVIAEPQIVYQTSIKQLSLETLIGSTFQSTNQRSISQIGTGYSSDDLLNSLASASSILTGSEIDVRYRYMGVFTRITANLKQRYLLSLNGRRDGSSRYGPANRYANFGSVGLGWIFSKETALKNMHWLSYGKLKASVGVTGNDQIGDYKYLDIYNTSTFPYQGVIPQQPRQLFNPTYNWEKVTKYEVGLDLAFFRDRVLIAANYYYNTSDNQLVDYGLPPSTGFNGILKNLPARVRNKGFELEFSAVAIKNKHWNWTSSFNITFPRNKLLRFDNLESSTYANTYVVGQPLFITKGYKSEGVDPSTGYYRFTDFNRNGTITSPTDQQAIIFTGQQWFGGWQNIITYKQLSLSFLVQVTKQKNAYSYVSLFPMPGNFTNQPTLVMERWMKTGENAAIQQFSVSGSSASTGYFYYRNSDAAYSNGSFIRMKNIYLSYKLKKFAGKQIPENNCVIFLQAQNLFTISNYQSLDPETRSLMPPVKMVTGGIQVTF